MHCRTVHTVVLFGILLVKSAPVADADPVGSLALAEEGERRYCIVLPSEPHMGKGQAARELSLFLGEMTGADYPIVSDDTDPVAHEIVVGRTSRKSADAIPSHLRTDNWEGFTLLREDEKLYILGNIPRATLYGVYDFLDVELGVRFLTSEVNHVPRKPTLRVVMNSRVFGPKIERRTIWEGLGGSSIVRNRMNGVGFGVAGELGGVKVIGPQTHTFNSLVSFDEHFDEHPEYFPRSTGSGTESMTVFPRRSA